MFILRHPGSLVDKKGRIQVPGMYDDVADVTEEEQKLYEKIDFDLGEYCKDVGVSKLLHGTKASRAAGCLLSESGVRIGIRIWPSMVYTRKESDSGLQALSMS